MKKFFVCCAALFLLTALSGCSGQSAAGFSQKDLALTVAGKEYHTRDSIEAVIEALGEDYRYAEGKSCNYDGLDKTYAYDEATFYTNPLEEGDLLSEIYSKNPDTVTSKGIGPGSSKNQVLAAYGDPAEADEDLLIYRAEEGPSVPSLCFELENDTVTAVFLTVDPV